MNIFTQKFNNIKNISNILLSSNNTHKYLDMIDKTSLLLSDILFGNIIYQLISNNYDLSYELFQPNLNINDLMIIDNLHDFTEKRSNIATIGNIRSNISNNIINNNIKIYLTENMRNYTKIQYSKQNINTINKKIQNINHDNKRNIIAKEFNIPINLNGTINNIQLNIDPNNIYFETPGYFKVNNAICPYKKSLDGASCNSDNNNLRKDNNIFHIKNYDGIIVNVNINGNIVQASLNNNAKYKYYDIFFSNADINSLNNIYFNNKYCCLNNEVKFIGNKLNSVVNNSDFYNYIYAGFHLKRLGDYFQFDYFNNSNIRVFQTKDIYCYLYAIYSCNPNKIIILEDKQIFIKIKYDNKIYYLTYSKTQNNFFDKIEQYLTNILKQLKLNQKIYSGGSTKISQRIIPIKRKIDKITAKNIFSNYNIRKNMIGADISYNTLKLFLDKLEIDSDFNSDILDLLKIINIIFGMHHLIATDIIDTIFIKLQNKYTDYNELDIINTVNEICKLVIFFGKKSEPDNYDYFIEMCNNIILIDKHIDRFEINDSDFANQIKILSIIYQKVLDNNPQDIHFGCWYNLYDIINFFDLYKINTNDNIDDILDSIEEQYNELHEEYIIDENIPGEEKYANKNDKPINNISENVINYYDKYLKYKLKYLELKYKNID